MPSFFGIIRSSTSTSRCFPRSSLTHCSPWPDTHHSLWALPSCYGSFPCCHPPDIHLFCYSYVSSLLTDINYTENGCRNSVKMSNEEKNFTNISKKWKRATKTPLLLFQSITTYQNMSVFADFKLYFWIFEASIRWRHHIRWKGGKWWHGWQHRWFFHPAQSAIHSFPVRFHWKRMPAYHHQS